MLRIRMGLLNVLKVLCIVLFTVLVAVVAWQVFTRQVIGNPSPWTTVTAQYMFVWLALFAATFVFGERGHIAVEFFAQRTPIGVQRVLALLVQVCVLAFALLAMVWGGIRGMSMSWDQVIPGFPFTVGQMYLALPVAGAMIAFLAVEDLILGLRGEELTPLAPTEVQTGEAAGLAIAQAAAEQMHDETVPAGPRTEAANDPMTERSGDDTKER